MKRVITAVLLCALALPVMAQNQPHVIKPMKEELAQVKRHAELLARVNRRNVELQKQQKKDLSEMLWIEQWVNTQHAGYTYDTSLDMFVENPPKVVPAPAVIPPAAPAPEKPQP